MATKADALTCSSPFTCRLCNLGEQSTEERGKTQSCPKATMAISDYLRHNLSDPGQGQRLEAGHLAPQRHGCPQTTPNKCRKVKPPDNPRQMKPPDKPRQVRKSETSRQGKPSDNPRQAKPLDNPRQVRLSETLFHWILSIWREKASVRGTLCLL